MPADRSGAVAGVLLAAGASTRMGKNKLLFDLNGEPVVRRAARASLAAGLDPVLAVVGHERDRVSAALSDLPVEIVANPDFAVGIHTSLRAGIAAVPASAAAAVAVLADMPLVTGPMIAALVGRYRDTLAPLVISEYGEVSAPPTLYDRSLFPELVAADKGCGKKVVRSHRAEAVAVPWPADLLADLDVPEDFERIRRDLAAGRISCAATS
jgi:molybdenum cofactor cytidylyltransferase